MKLDGAPYLADDFELAMDLIGVSVCEKTSAHMLAIEALLRQAAVTRDPVQRFLDDAWPHIRARLVSYPVTTAARD